MAGKRGQKLGVGGVELGGVKLGGLEGAMREGWERVRGVLSGEKGRDELLRRLWRRAGAEMGRPGRVFCLAYRAADSRIDDYRMPIVVDGEDLVFRNPPSRLERRQGGRPNVMRRRRAVRYGEHVVDRYCRHEVTLRGKDLVRLAEPVRLPEEGCDYQVAADLLGIHDAMVMRGVGRGWFEVEWRAAGEVGRKAWKTMGRRPGAKGTPAGKVAWVRSGRWFDPGCGRACGEVGRAGHGLGEGDELWVKVRRRMIEGIDLGYEQHVVREPMWAEGVVRLNGMNYWNGERVWMREAGRRAEFRGWRWVCPGCGERARVLYLPMEVPRVGIGEGEERELMAGLERGEREALEAVVWPKGRGVLACGECHRVRTCTKWDKAHWNHLVAVMSGGVLYGREVEK